MKQEKPFRIVHYINQFFAGIGGEDKASIPPLKKDGAIGSGKLIELSSQGAFEIVGTVICGDNYFVENESALTDIVEFIKEYEPDGFIAGPAFAAGRYGEACARISDAIKRELEIPVLTGLSDESPSVQEYREKIPIVKTGASARDMKKSVPIMVKIILELLKDKEMANDSTGLIFPMGKKRNVLKTEHAAERAVQMLLAKYYEKPWQTELPIQTYDKVQPAPPVGGSIFTIALITDGGLILKGNPDNMVSGRSTKWCAIDIKNEQKLTPNLVEVNHFGYDTKYVQADPNRLVPLDIARKFEREGKLNIHPFIYSTAGVATSVETGARFGKEIAIELKRAGVHAAILTST